MTAAPDDNRCEGLAKHYAGEAASIRTWPGYLANPKAFDPYRLDETAAALRELVRVREELAIAREHRDAALDEITAIEKEIGFDNCKAMVNFLSSGKLPDPATESRSAVIAAILAKSAAFDRLAGGMLAECLLDLVNNVLSKNCTNASCADVAAAIIARAKEGK